VPLSPTSKQVIVWLVYQVCMWVREASLRKLGTPLDLRFRVVLIRPATTKRALPRLPLQGWVDLVQGGLVFPGRCLGPPYALSIGQSSSTGSRSSDLEHCKADAVPWTCNEPTWCRPCHPHHPRSRQHYLYLTRQGQNALCRGHFPWPADLPSTEPCPCR
jgi:hypothetical protein